MAVDPIDLTGQQFTRLLALRFLGAWKQNRWWECRCVCGNLKVASTSMLRAGLVKSCNCLRNTRRITHGASVGGVYSHEYSCWRAAKYRCCSESDGQYEFYGGAGIRFHEAWQDFSCFIMDIGLAPSDQHSLDRYPDKHGSYVPGNVRWATRSQQQNNRRDNRILSVNGQSLTVRECVDQFGAASYSAIWSRLRLGWSDADAATIPTGTRRMQQGNRAADVRIDRKTRPRGNDQDRSEP